LRPDWSAICLPRAMSGCYPEPPALKLVAAKAMKAKVAWLNAVSFLWRARRNGRS